MNTLAVWVLTYITTSYNRITRSVFICSFDRKYRIIKITRILRNLVRLPVFVVKIYKTLKGTKRYRNKNAMCLQHATE